MRIVTVHNTFARALGAGQSSPPPSVPPVAYVPPPTTGFTDNLGINHPNMPSGLVPIIARLYTRFSTSSGGTRSTLYDPYYTGNSEGFDNASQMWAIGTEANRPFQSAITLLNPGQETTCGRFVLDPGDPGGQSFARCFPYALNASGGSHYPSQCHQFFRRMYWHMVFKFDPLFPSIAPMKWGFFDGQSIDVAGTGYDSGSSPNSFIQQRSAQNSSPTDPFDNQHINLQGTPDDNLTDAATLTNTQWSQGHSGVEPPFEVLRDQWTSYEWEFYMASPGGVRDGWIRLWKSTYDDVTNTWSAAPLAMEWTGLRLSSKANPSRQAYWLRFQRLFMGNIDWDITETTSPGVSVALDYMAMGDSEGTW